MSQTQTKQKNQSGFAQAAGGALAVVEPRLAMPIDVEEFAVDKSQWRVLVEAIFPNAKSAASVVMALAYCRVRKFDIMKRPVHIVPMYSSVLGRMVETVWPSIGEIRTTAFRTGQYAGMDAIEWGPVVDQEFDIIKEVWENGRQKDTTTTKRRIRYHEWARLTIYRMVPGVATPCKFPGPQVFWLEICAKDKNGAPNDRWLGNPNGQHEKTAEAAALRRAFPEEVGNDYSADEMEGQTIIGEMKDITPKAAPPVPPDDEDEAPAKQQTTTAEKKKAGPPTEETVDTAPILASLLAITDRDLLNDTWIKEVQPIWPKLTREQRKLLQDSTVEHDNALKDKAEAAATVALTDTEVQALADQFDAAAEKLVDVPALDALWDEIVKPVHERIPSELSESILSPLYDGHRTRIEEDAFPGDRR